MRRVYLDHNATTPLDARVREAMDPYFSEVFGNPSSPHQYGHLAKQALEESRAIIAGTIGAKPDEIVFTSGGTESDNLALRGIAYHRGKGHIVSSSVEHHAVLKTLRDLEKMGFKVTYLPVDSQGRIDPDEVKRSIRKDTILISIMYANNETGVIEPISDIARIANEWGIPFHSDAVQAVGKIEVNVKTLGVDLLSLSAHKIYGPKGIGALFVKDGLQLSPLITGGSHERGMRAGTENIPGIVGFARALHLAAQEMATYHTRVAQLRDKLEVSLLHNLPQVTIHSAQADRLPHTSCMGFASVEAESILLHLDLKGIAASSGSACTTGEPEPSHVLLAMGVPTQVAQGSIRISLGKYNTEEEIDYAITAIEEIVTKLRYISSLWGTHERQAV